MLVVDFSALDDLAGSIESMITQTEDILDALNRQITEVAQLWTGAASVGFQRTFTSWMQAQQDLRQRLSELHDLVVTAHDNHATALTTNVSIWQV
jgi:WXG100 family type VII secretion target